MTNKKPSELKNAEPTETQNPTAANPVAPPTPAPAAEIASKFASEEAAKALLADQKEIQATLAWLVLAASKDHSVDAVEVSFGQTLYNILQLPLETQKPIVFAIADRNKTPRPEYATQAQRGRPSVGRNELAAALYGKWPEMLVKEADRKDTRAAMRVTDHVQRYKISAGLLKPRPARQVAADKVTARKARPIFAALWKIADENEQYVITALFERLGIEEKMLDEWVEAPVPAAASAAA